MFGGKKERGFPWASQDCPPSTPLVSMMLLDVPVLVTRE